MEKTIECYIKRTVQKSQSISGDKAKTYVKIILPIKDKTNAVIIFHKYVLSGEHELYEKYGFKLLKSFKNKGLYLQVSSFKLSTFSEITNWINSL